MSSERKKILETVKAIRESRHYSQEDMAARMSISQSSYARFELGKSKTDLEILELFAKKCGISLLELFYYPNEIPVINNEVEALLTVKLKADKKEEVLKLVFGDKNLEILNK